jgi:putative transposase
MKPSRFTEEQIIGILAEQEAGAKTADVFASRTAARRSQMEGQVRGLDLSDAKRQIADMIRIL